MLQHPATTPIRQMLKMQSINIISDFLNQPASEKGWIALVGMLIGLAVFSYIFYIIAKASFQLEKYSGRASHTIAKTILIAFFPTVLGALELFKIEVPVPEKLFIVLTVVTGVIVVIWNFIVYGWIGGIMFSIVHAVFGLLASLGMVSLVMIAIVLVVLFFAGAVGGSPAGSSGSNVTSVRNVKTGQVYNVSVGANGETYIAGGGRLYTDEDYSGYYYDSYGNEYTAT